MPLCINHKDSSCQHSDQKVHVCCENKCIDREALMVSVIMRNVLLICEFLEISNEFRGILL